MNDLPRVICTRLNHPDGAPVYCAGPDVFSQDINYSRNAVYRGGKFGEADAHGAPSTRNPSGVDQQQGHGHMGLAPVSGPKYLGGCRG